MMEPPAVARSVNGVPIRLTGERWQHIIQQHPEMTQKRDDLLEALRTPDTVYGGHHGTLMAIRREDDLYLVVVYGESGTTDGFVVTSYLTRRPGRRKVVWRRS